MMSGNKKYVAFFDLDKTIIGTNSGYAIVRLAQENGLMGKGELVRAIFQSLLYKSKLRDTSRIISSMGTWLKGKNENAVNDLAEQAVKKYLKDSVFEQAYDEITMHKRAGAETVILSSAISAICRPIAAITGIDSLQCTEMESINGILTGNPKGNYCYAQEKQVRISLFCREHGLDPESAFYYADSISDLSALETVGNPVCVNPDRKLKRIATERRWRICNWHR
jgi:HAD superfamily hydrolase (TIGR01490 family)